MDKTLWIIGDSNLGAFKELAERNDPVLAGWTPRFWGFLGHSFLGITIRNRVARPPSITKAERQEKWIPGSSSPLDLAEVDRMLLVGCRTRTHQLFGALLRRADSGQHFSDAFLADYVDGWFKSLPGYDKARRLTAAHRASGRAAQRQGGADTRRRVVYFSPTTLRTQSPTASDQGIDRPQTELSDRLWNLIDQRVRADGMILLRQPQETVVRGYLTDPAYGVAPPDDIHRNADYAALIMARLAAAEAQAERPSGSVPSSSDLSSPVSSSL